MASCSTHVMHAYTVRSRSQSPKLQCTLASPLACWLSCYWWNQSTNVTTPVGAPKPDAWVQVVAKDGRVYFWNKDSSECLQQGASAHVDDHA